MFTMNESESFQGSLILVILIKRLQKKVLLKTKILFSYNFREMQLPFLISELFKFKF